MPRQQRTGWRVGPGGVVGSPQFRCATGQPITPEPRKRGRGRPSLSEGDAFLWFRLVCGVLETSTILVAEPVAVLDEDTPAGASILTVRNGSVLKPGWYRIDSTDREDIFVMRSRIMNAAVDELSIQPPLRSYFPEGAELRAWNVTPPRTAKQTTFGRTLWPIPVMREVVRRGTGIEISRPTAYRWAAKLWPPDF